MTPTSPQQVPPPTANHAYQPTQFQTQSLVQQQSTFGSSPVGQAPAPQQARQAPTPEPPKQKQPLPEEYVYLQTVFNELRIQCINHANNPVSDIQHLYASLCFLIDHSHSSKPSANWMMWPNVSNVSTIY